MFNYDEADLNYSVNISQASLDSVLNNLSDNSLQHGASKIKITTKLNRKSNQQSIFLNFHDNGSGISQSNRKRIFTPFFTTKRESGGTGLGLGIVESILKASDGKIMNQEVDSGALFIVQLKLS